MELRDIICKMREKNVDNSDEREQNKSERLNVLQKAPSCSEESRSILRPMRLSNM